MINLSSFIRFHALQDPERVAIVYDGLRINYAEFYDRILAAAELLVQSGVGAGDCVGLLMNNSPAFLDIYFAASHIGAIVVPINFRLSADEVRYIVADAGVGLLFIDDDATTEDLGVKTVRMSDDAQRDIRTITPPATGIAPAPRKMSDLFRLMYTSGTTAHPKGVMHTYENFYVKCAEHTIVFQLNAQTRLLVAGPLYHVGAMDLPGIGVLWMGGMLCVLRNSDATGILTAIQNERLSCGALVPYVTGTLLNHPDRDTFDVSSLQWIVGGGERTPETRVRQFRSYFPNARYIDCYGLTETCSGDAMMVAGYELSKVGSVGFPTPHVEIEIRDDDGNRLEAGEIGEICVMGPKVTPGYWNDPAKTKEAFFGEWLRTGDVGYFDADGFLFLVDRKKDMILSGGENIAASEVERVLYELPFVQEAAVIGLPDARWGERPVAVIVVKPGTTFDAETAENFCRKHLAGFKVPKQWIVREALPRTASNKVLKRVLRDELVKGDTSKTEPTLR